MISVTKNAEKKLLPLLRGEPWSSLRIVSGPDQRLRLILDKTTDNEYSQSENYVIDVQGQDLVFDKVDANLKLTDTK